MKCSAGLWLRFLYPPLNRASFRVASAVNADHADTADTATNALKLGGYDASEYMRKDEVKTIKSSYETLEWDGAGTYSWTVPEGVTKINVTTVGGGGSPGYIRTFPKVSNKPPYMNLFPGGSGGETTEGVILDVKTGDKVTITIGKGAIPKWAGEDLSINKWGDWYTPPANISSGNKGGDSYIAINNITQSTTKALGGNGGDINFKIINNNYPYTGANAFYTYGTYNLTGKNGGYGGRPNTWIYHTTAGLNQDMAMGYRGSYGAGGIGNYNYLYNSRTRLREIYSYGGGGGSYGDGAGTDGGASRGGGGCWNWGSYKSGAPGYVKISYTRLYSD